MPGQISRRDSLALIIAPLIAPRISTQDESVVFEPDESHDLLVNPGIGITTFQRFNGVELNEGGEWSEVGPTGPLKQAARQPEFPSSSIAYCRWFWSQLQPRRDEIRWEIIDTALTEAAARQQTLAIRVMPYDNKEPLPTWYRASGARRANKPTGKDGALWEPDMEDPLYLNHWKALISELGARYDGHPALESVDIASIGPWGEGSSDYMPSLERERELVDVYFDAFKCTFLLSNEQPRTLEYALQRGAGWRLDCLGDMGSPTKEGHTFAHMTDRYPQLIESVPGMAISWRRRPVVFETCAVPARWQQKGWDVDAILDRALTWHVSALNIKSSPIPPEWADRFTAFQKRMGYRLVLRRLDVPSRIKPGEMMAIRMRWSNIGVAPVYRSYQVALEFRSADTRETVPLDADVRTWLPGDCAYSGMVAAPRSLRPGLYRLRLALLDPRTLTPAIRLAITSPHTNGWYDLGGVNVA